MGVRQCGVGCKRMFASDRNGPNGCGVEQVIVERHETTVTDQARARMPRAVVFRSVPRAWQ